MPAFILLIQFQKHPPESLYVKKRRKWLNNSLKWPRKMIRMLNNICWTFRMSTGGCSEVEVEFTFSVSGKFLLVQRRIQNANIVAQRKFMNKDITSIHFEVSKPFERFFCTNQGSYQGLEHLEFELL